MCSIKITLKQTDGSEQTFARPEQKGQGDGSRTSDLAMLREDMGELQAQVNEALTVLVNREKEAAATGTKAPTRQQSEDHDEDDDEEEDEATNGSGEPPEKLRKTS